MSDKDAYAILMEGLGFPGSTRLRHIMEELMTPEQARMAAALPGTPEEVAKKTQIALDRVKDGLDGLFFKGVVFPQRGDFRKRESFRFARRLLQLCEGTTATQKRDVVKDRRFYEQWYDFRVNEFYPVWVERQTHYVTPAQRIIPAYKAIKDLPGVLPCENFPEILKAQSLIAVTPCACRYITAGAGRPCKFHDEVAHFACIQFGRAAEYVIARGSGKKLSLEEALELNDIIEESGLLHKSTNDSVMPSQNTSCQCCRDCCIRYAPMDQAGLPISLVWEKSRFGSYVNLDACTGCQVCIDRCQFDAITMERPEGSKKFKAAIDPEKCFGCGGCVVGCKPGAIKMRVVRPPEHIPAVRPAEVLRDVPEDAHLRWLQRQSKW